MSQNIAKSAPQHSQASSSQSSKIIELFLTTLIYGKDLDFYLRVLQGICGSQPNHTFRRQLIFEGPRDRKLLGVPLPLMRQRDPKRSQEWISLNEPLSRQAYYLTAFWELSQRSFGKRGEDGALSEDSGLMDLNQTPGTLRWAEWADASLQRGMNSRQIVQIEAEQSLLGTLRAMNHRPTTENVRETYLYVHDNVVVEFTRHYYLPGQTSSPIQQISQKLPPREDLIPCDGQAEGGKWLVTAYRLVLNGTDQELMQEGVQELQSFQDLLKDCLDLKMIKTNERHDIDPRVK